MSTWESSHDGSTNWIAATLVPTSAGNSISIRNGHTVTIAANATVDQFVINTGGQVTIPVGDTLTFLNGTGTDLTVDGILLNQGCIIMPSSSAFALNATGTYIHNTASPISGNFLNNTTFTANASSNFITRGSASLFTPVSFSNRTFGNYTLESGDGTNYNVAVSGTGALTVNGTFTVANNVTLDENSFTGNVNFNGDVLVNGSFNAFAKNIALGSGKTMTINGTYIDTAFTITTTGATFAVSPGATLKTGFASGLNGMLLGTGTINLSTAANYQYIGKVAQVTGALLPASVNNLAVNNTGGLTLSSALTVNGSLLLTKGILTTDPTKILTIATTGSYTGGSTASHVSGPMNINAASAGNYTFPVGKGGVYHACTVNPTAGGSYQAEYFNSVYSDLTIDGSLESISNLEYWDIKQLSGTSASVSLSLNGTAIPGGTSTNLGVVAHFNGTAWTSENASAIAPGNSTSGTALSNNLSSFSPFTFGTVAAPTPLTLLSFNGSISNGLVKLTWLTSNEINVRNFNIERSADGRNFNSIGSVNAINGQLSNLYNFADPSAINGIAYYRLQMIDRDGKFKYSGIIAFNAKKADVFSIFPNPAKDDLFVTHEKAINGASMQVLTIDGKKIAVQAVAKNDVQTTIITANLPVGVYQLVYINGGTTEHMRFIKQ